MAWCMALFGQTDTGGIAGFVYDDTGAVIPGVTVTAVDRDRGIRRESETTETGEFAFRYVDPGMYSLRFAAADFAPLAVDGLEVRVGETAIVSPRLAVAVAEESVVVSGESARSEIEPQRVQQSDHIDAVRIQNLPINRRDYLSLALLTPGVVDTGYVANATDRRITTTGSSGLGIGGTNGRGNTFMIDGLDNVSIVGGVRSRISQEAVYEFQVNRNSFSHRAGRGSRRRDQHRDAQRHEPSARVPVWPGAQPPVSGPELFRPGQERVHQSPERGIDRRSGQAQRDVLLPDLRAPGPPRVPDHSAAGRPVIPHLLAGLPARPGQRAGSRRAAPATPLGQPARLWARAGEPSRRGVSF